ncbi:peptidase M48, Ste24p [Candidatus Koribacter versatilis Ellin345]|uniref:Peptidase M48, Ste24p n=1 Tax=Koribacter versatilis (strain Ellin345) TaxID=204669 RepID=Q1ILN4_KORVE|nr:M48 family metalloprotease [Candidatus Koribacter versatilis]ABF42216.1 peptidase M48, Ste24p [Candidatus Koribacter versatilis Ellin345]
MRGISKALIVLAASMISTAAFAQADAAAPQQQSSSSTALDQVVDRLAAKEAEYVKNMRQYTPLVETYLQEMQPDQALGEVPKNDWYHLSRLSLANQKIDVTTFSGKNDLSAQEANKGNMMSRTANGMSNAALKTLTFGKAGKGGPQYGYMANGFDSMVIVDTTGLSRARYDFKFVRREFLGDVRTIVLDVSPKFMKGDKHQDVRFLGRIWIEDEGSSIVRVNGTYTPAPKGTAFFHFDTWRINMGPGLWLPAYIYSEESGLAEDKKGNVHYNFRAQTRLWGYNVTRPENNSELTEVMVDAPDPVKDQSTQNTDASPLASQRQWQREAEDNILERMQKLGLVAPPGEVDKVLETVVNNIEVTNNLDVQPEIRCRVMLTAPLESFNIGHTIVLSRGFLDTLPDEASLAAVLAHEMGHILLEHKFDTKYAFSDRMLFPDNHVFQRIDIKHTPKEEADADAKAADLLQNSPYKDKLSSPGLFLAALQQRAPQLPNLLTANMGTSVVYGAPAKTKKGETPQAGVPAPGSLRMANLQGNAPKLDPGDMKQIAALPLGGRIKMDPWTDRIEISKAKSVPLLSARDKMPFELTPIFPYLTRGTTAAPATASKSTNGQ